MKITITTLLFIGCSLLSHAQTNTTATGGTATGTGGTVNFSVGQVDYKSRGGGGFVVLEGLQHPINETILPVTLTRFAGACNGSAIILSWETATEMNSAHFIIEKSGEAANWTVLQSVAAAGHSAVAKKYTATDNKPFEGTNYYRLKTVGLDGKSAYSSIVAVASCNGGKPGITVYPNPTTQGIYINNATGTSTGQYELYNATGQKVAGSSLPSATTFVAMQSLPVGTYYLKVTTGNSAVQTIKIVKSN